MVTDWIARLKARQNKPTNDFTPAAAWKRHRKNNYSRYYDDPLGFNREVLGQAEWDGNRRILTGVLEHDRVVIRAGRKVSKSNSLSVLAYWWLLCRGGRVLMTSTTYQQVNGVLWLELQTLNERARLGLTVPLDPSTGIRRGLASIVGRTASNREAMQGYSGPDVLYIVDEASGVDSEIIEAIEGNCAGGGKIVMAGNPTQTSGRYYDACYNPNTRWHVIHLNSELSPNVLEGKMVIPGLATRDWIEQMRDEWGVESPQYQVHVLGNAPLMAENAVIGLGLVAEAKQRHEEAIAGDEPLRIGVDVARFGDDVSVVQGVRGYYAYQPVSLSSMDGIQVAAATIAFARQNRAGDETVRVKVDVIGVGASVVDNLNRTKKEENLDWLEVVSVNAANKSYHKDYERVRDQLWFGLRDWLKDGGTLPNHHHLEQELVAPTYSFTLTGKMKVESKDDIKEKIGRSPDFADSLALAVFEPRVVKPTKVNKVIPGWTGIVG